MGFSLFHVVVCFSSFQGVFGYFSLSSFFCRLFFSWFQVVRGCFNWSLVVLGSSSYFRMFTMLFGVVVGCFRLCQVV